MEPNEIRPEQQTLMDLIAKHARTIPWFIDAKKQEEYYACLRIQDAFEWIYDLCQPDFMPDSQIKTTQLQVAALFRAIKDPILNKKSKEYFQRKLNEYLKMALNTECYEVVANLKTYLKP